MRCTRVEFVDGAAAIVCTSGGRRCAAPGCGGLGAYQCDAPVVRRNRKATCDRYMCARHRVNRGPNVDCCAEHAEAELPLSWTRVET
jgi:hypothetical protein